MTSNIDDAPPQMTQYIGKVVHMPGAVRAHGANIVIGNVIDSANQNKNGGRRSLYGRTLNPLIRLIQMSGLNGRRAFDAAKRAFGTDNIGSDTTHVSETVYGIKPNNGFMSPIKLFGRNFYPGWRGAYCPNCKRDVPATSFDANSGRCKTNTEWGMSCINFDDLGSQEPISFMKKQDR